MYKSSASSQISTEELSKIIVNAIQEHNPIVLRDLYESGVSLKDLTIQHHYHGALNLLAAWVVYANPHERQKSMEVCKVLIASGVSPKQAEKLTDVDFIIHHIPGFIYRNQNRMIDLLVKMNVRRIDTSKKSKNDLNLMLHKAIADRTWNIAEVALKAGADPYFIDRTNSAGHLKYFAQSDLPGYTAMDKALYDGDIELISLLIRYGVDVRSKIVPLNHVRAFSPLQIAIQESFSTGGLEAMLLAGTKIEEEDFDYAKRDSKNYKLLRYAHAMQQHFHPIQQIIAVLETNTSDVVSTIANGFMNLFFQDPILLGRNELTSLLKQMDSKSDLTFEQYNTIIELLNCNERFIPADKRDFIQGFVLASVEKKLGKEQDASACLQEAVAESSQARV